MKKVSIINNVDGSTYGAKFDNDTDMNSWIASCESKNSWGNVGDYTVTITDLSTDPDYLLDVQMRKAQVRLDACQYIMKRVAARNRLVDLTDQQTQMFLQEYQPIIALLQVGELGLAKTAIAGLVPVGGITQDEINLIVGIADSYLQREAAIV